MWFMILNPKSHPEWSRLCPRDQLKSRQGPKSQREPTRDGFTSPIVGVLRGSESFVMIIVALCTSLDTHTEDAKKI